MQTTVGQLMLMEALPREISRGGHRVLDKAGVKQVMEELTALGPDVYRDATKRLYDLGAMAAHASGSSFGVADLTPPPEVLAERNAIRKKVIDIVNRDDLTDDQREELIKSTVFDATNSLEKNLYELAVKNKNPYAIQVLSGSRGGKSDMRSLMVGDMLVSDHRDRVIPVPVLNSYGEGLDPAEYWAGSYGARKGSVSTKFAVAKAGFFGKQMVQAAHRVVVTEPDCQTERGIPVDARDPDNEGAVLAAPSGTFAAGTILTPRILAQLKDKQIAVRSPLTCSAGHGVCQRCAGVREKGEFPELGENIGIAAATSLTEQLSQALLGVKHGGGRAKSLKGHEEIKGYDLVNQLVQSPDNFRDEAAVSELDGIVGAITPAPQGGQYVTVGDKQHFVPEGSAVLVKTGQRVDAGDILSEGIPHPDKLVRHRGLGAGRLAFVDEFRKAYRNEGLKANRRNIEILTRGLVNHVRVNDLDGPQSSLPDDVLEYQTLERDYQPRVGALAMRPKLARGLYLEQPAAHYTIGTRVTQRVADDLDARGVPEIMAHADTPSFQPEMVRAMENLTNSPDWQVRMGGSYLGKGLQEAVHRGRSSQRGESYIPGLAEGKDFGTKLKTEGIY